MSNRTEDVSRLLTYPEIDVTIPEAKDEPSCFDQFSSRLLVKLSETKMVDVLHDTLCNLISGHRAFSRGYWYFFDAMAGRFDSYSSCNPLYETQEFAIEWSTEMFPESTNDPISFAESQREIFIELTGTRLGTTEVTFEVPSLDSQRLSAELATLCRKWKMDAQIVLEAKHSPFDGFTVRDALLCLGLEFGEAGQAYWFDENGGWFFTVAFNEVRYLEWDELFSDSFEPFEIRFLLEVPRVKEPYRYFDRMLIAANYCQQRLGGELKFETKGKTVGLEKLKPKILEVETEMKQKNIFPGYSSALRLT